MIEGIYYYEESFLRFYRNGTFISCLIKNVRENEETFTTIMEWFTLVRKIIL